MELDFDSHWLGEDADLAHFIQGGVGDPVVLVHGGGAGADAISNFGPALRAISDQYRVYGVDMLGFGRSAMPDPTAFEYSQDARQRHLETFLRGIDIGPAHVVGNSMGGATAMGVAMHAPSCSGR